MRGEQSTKAGSPPTGWPDHGAFGADDGRRHRRRLPERPARIGIVSGLVLYQLVFVVNVMRVVTSQGENGVTMLYAAKTIHVGDHPHFGLFA